MTSLVAYQYQVLATRYVILRAPASSPHGCRKAAGSSSSIDAKEHRELLLMHLSLRMKRPLETRATPPADFSCHWQKQDICPPQNSSLKNEMESFMWPIPIWIYPGHTRKGCPFCQQSRRQRWLLSGSLECLVRGNDKKCHIVQRRAR